MGALGRCCRSVFTRCIIVSSGGSFVRRLVSRVARSKLTSNRFSGVAFGICCSFEKGVISERLTTCSVGSRVFGVSISSSFNESNSSVGVLTGDKSGRAIAMDCLGSVGNNGVGYGVSYLSGALVRAISRGMRGVLDLGVGLSSVNIRAMGNVSILNNGLDFSCTCSSSCGVSFRNDTRTNRGCSVTLGLGLDNSSVSGVVFGTSLTARLSTGPSISNFTVANGRSSGCNSCFREVIGSVTSGFSRSLVGPVCRGCCSRCMCSNGRSCCSSSTSSCSSCCCSSRCSSCCACSSTSCDCICSRSCCLWFFYFLYGLGY